MTPAKFPEASTSIGPPEGFDESQIGRIDAYVADIRQGNLDGVSFVVVAWKPSLEELEQLNKGNLVYLRSIGGLLPHYIGTSFEDVSQ